MAEVTASDEGRTTRARQGVGWDHLRRHAAHRRRRGRKISMRCGRSSTTTTCPKDCRPCCSRTPPRTWGGCGCCWASADRRRLRRPARRPVGTMVRHHRRRRRRHRRLPVDLLPAALDDPHAASACSWRFTHSLPWRPWRAASAARFAQRLLSRPADCFRGFDELYGTAATWNAMEDIDRRERRLGGRHHRRRTGAAVTATAGRSSPGARRGLLQRRRPGIGRVRCARHRVLGAARLPHLPGIRELRRHEVGVEAEAMTHQQVETAQGFRPRWARSSPASSSATPCYVVGDEWAQMEAGTLGNDDTRAWPCSARSTGSNRARPVRKPPDGSGSTRPPTASRPASTGSTAPTGSSRLPCGSPCSPPHHRRLPALLR